MPRSPRSSLELAGSEFRRVERLMNSRVVETFGVLSNTRTEPVFCTTYQRAELPGSWSMATGWVKFGRPANTRCTASDTVLLGGSPARQVVFDGRASRPPAGGEAPLVVALTEADCAEVFAGLAASVALTV